MLNQDKKNACGHLGGNSIRDPRNKNKQDGFLKTEVVGTGLGENLKKTRGGKKSVSTRQSQGARSSEGNRVRRGGGALDGREQA